MIGFQPEHLTQIDVREHEALGLYTSDNFNEKMAHLAMTSVDAGTFVIGGQILCIAGFTELWQGVVEVWVIPSKIVPKHSRLFAQTFRSWVDHLALTGQYHRIQTSCLDDKLHNRWLSWLGFEKEGVMRKFSKDREDYAIYAKVT